MSVVDIRPAGAKRAYSQRASGWIVYTSSQLAKRYRTSRPLSKAEESRFGLNQQSPYRTHGRGILL